jgi:hypothetical protein
VFAQDPATGTCQPFPSACAVPVEWAACGGSDAPSCVNDLDCATTEHCSPPDDPALAPACVANDLCVDGSDCASGVCDLSAPHQCEPGDTACEDKGLCQTPPSTDPMAMACVTRQDCADGQVCPAEFGGCSVELDDGSCPSTCEQACTGADDVCAPGTHCNIADFCAGPMGYIEGCAGFCVAD